MNKTIVMGIEVESRIENATEVQKLLTEYGCYIKTRLGLHETEKGCSPKGLILLVFSNDAGDKANTLQEKLKHLPGVSVNTMAI